MNRSGRMPSRTVQTQRLGFRCVKKFAESSIRIEVTFEGAEGAANCAGHQAMEKTLAAG